MAAGTISKPGTAYGPCEDDCDHLDCRDTRAEAEALCVRCQQPIGYDARYYRVAEADAIGGVPSVVHALCEELAAEAGAES